MTKLAYLDCPTGIAGDMCLGALVDTGVPLEYLEEHLNRLGIAKQYRLWAEKVHRNGQQATKIHVQVMTDAGLVEEAPGAIVRATTPTSQHSDHPASNHSHCGTESGAGESAIDPHPHHAHPHHHPDHAHHSDHTGTRHLPEIERMILAAGLPTRVETWSLAIFRQLAEAEGAVHGIAAEQVHFHEVGATDAIVDIVGTCLGLDWLGVEKIFCSALPTGGGTIRAAHGQLPVPAPAVLKLFELRQIPLYSNGIEKELVTPTGAAIATTLASQFGPPPSMTLLRVGLGAGTIDLPLPNILRLWVGEQVGRGKGGSGRVGEWGREEDRGGGKSWLSKDLGLVEPIAETIVVLETQVDDLNPQAIGYLYERLFAAGALDVFTQAIGMKKSRSGLLLTVICPPAVVATCETLIFRETTTLGIRRSTQQRQILHRELQSVQIPYGTVQVKVAWADSTHRTPINVQPEYEDCATIARQHNIPWREAHRLALEAWHRERANNRNQEA